MSDRALSAHRHAQRLLRWYPKEWRDRYGDEFGELLAAEITEQPRSWPRSIDVACNGVVAHLAGVGLTGRALNASDQPRRTLVTFACAAAVFLTFAFSMWSQLAIAWTSSRPATTPTYTAIILMTVAVVICVTAGLVATVPLAWTVLVAAGRRRTPGLLRPGLLFSLGVTALIVGGHRFQRGWPGTGGHPWVHRGVVVGWVFKLLWTSTLAVSAYWAHPTILLRLPASEIAWMAISPVALIVTVTGAAKTISRLDMSRRLLRFLVHTAKAAASGFGLFVFATLIWLVDGGTGPADLFQAGTIDLIGLAVMTVALSVAVRAAQRTAESSSLPDV